MRSLRLILLVAVVLAASSALAAEEGLTLIGKAEGLRIVGEEGLIYRVVPQGRALGVRVVGPGEVTLRLRRQLGGAAKGPVSARIERDDAQVGDTTKVPGSDEAAFVGKHGRASTAVIQTIPVTDGEHVVTVRAEGGGTLAVSFAFAAIVGDGGAGMALAGLTPLTPLAPLALAPLAPPAPPPPPPPEPATGTQGRTLVASEVGAGEPAAPSGVTGELPAAEAGAEEPFLAVLVRAGLAVQPQFGATGFAVGLSADAAVALENHLAVGLAVDYYSYRVEATGVPIPGAPGAVADLSSELWVLPILATVTYRLPLGGELIKPYVGAGGGVFVTGVSTSPGGAGAELPETAGSTVAPGGVALVGLGIPAGPGRIAAEARFNVASGEVEGASKGLSAGGSAAQAGYQLVF